MALWVFSNPFPRTPLPTKGEVGRASFCALGPRSAILRSLTKSLTGAGRALAFLSDHPSSEQRIADIKRELPEAKAAFVAHK